MKILSALAGLMLTTAAYAQSPNFEVHRLSLPKELAEAENQFSGLFVHQGQLFLLSESRVQEQAEGKLYAIRLTDLDRKIADTAYVLPFRKYTMPNLDVLRAKVEAAGQRYEGLEAIVMDGNQAYFSLETETSSPLGYLFRGELTDGALRLDPDFLLPITKPRAADGSPIYNAAFEAVAKNRKSLFAFFEYNYFPTTNPVSQIPLRQLSSGTAIGATTIGKLPFRITDITPTGRNRFTAINYFFSGGGADTAYRVPRQDVEADQLVRSGTSFRSYARLIEMRREGNHFTWQPLWPFPDEYRGYNWEGIAAYRRGYFVLNDKYTPRKPYQSTLLYLRRK